MDYLSKEAEMVDKEIEQVLNEDGEPQELVDATMHLFKAGGKRLRPVLTLTASRVVGGDSDKAVGAAAAFEILHTFSLVHDDIMDRDGYRRGVETVHKVWGEPLGIMSGDALFAKVFELLAKSSESRGVSSGKIVQTVEAVSKASYKICQGQALDMSFEDRDRVKEFEYLDMVNKKTAALMEASTRVGALLGGGTEEEVDNLSEYGRLLGVAFQMHDDYLGAVGERDKVGKPIGSDIRKGKWNFLTVSAFERASQKDRKILKKVLGNSDATEEDVARVLDIFHRTGALDYTENRSRELVEEAKSYLEGLPSSEPKEFLLEIADFSIEREL